MNKQIKQKILKSLFMIIDDTKSDIIELDGKPFNGKTVAEQFGYHAAAIATLADMLTEILNEFPDTE